MKTDPGSLAHVRHVADNMRDKDAAEFLAVSFHKTRQELADSLVERYARGADTYCFSLDDGTPVAVGAMVEGRPNVITLMFFATDRFGEIALPLARFTKRQLFPRYFAAGVHRIECISIDGYSDNHRWIALLGLNWEAEFPCFGKDGQKFHQFALVK